MKQLCSCFITAFFCILLLSSCSRNTCTWGCDTPQPNYLRETWLNQVNLDSSQWLVCADRWFLTGNPNKAEISDFNAPVGNALTTMKVRVPDFVNIISEGNYQVQIIGGQDHNSVSIIGPNYPARLVAVNISGETLRLHQSPDCEPSMCARLVSRVIVRIGVHTLRVLNNRGNGNIYARNIYSDQLSVATYGAGKTMLVGRMNLQRVRKTGPGNITIIGANTTALDLKVFGGTVNISGNVGVNTILNSGSGNINIIGANSRSLIIDASGYSTTSIAGLVNLKRVTATGHSRVYVYWVNSPNLIVNENNAATVGLAGVANNLNVTLQGSSRFFGRYLRAGQVYVRTLESSHANIAADQKLFADAEKNSSIYYTATTSNISLYTSNNGKIVLIENDPTPYIPRCPQPWNNPGRYK